MCNERFNQTYPREEKEVGSGIPEAKAENTQYATMI